MSWDTAVPAGSRAINLGDDDIRTFKTDIQTALRGNNTVGVEAVFPGADAANPVFRPRFLRGTTAARAAASASQGLYINTTLNTIQRCDDSSWVDIATLIPSGTKMVFFQVSAPTGWTKDTSAMDGYLLKVVTGSNGGDINAGSHAVSSLGHTHAFESSTSPTQGSNTTQDGAVTVGRCTAYAIGVLGASVDTLKSTLGGTTGTGTLTAISNVNVIICSKD